MIILSLEGSRLRINHNTKRDNNSNHQSLKILKITLSQYRRDLTLSP